MKSNSPNVKGRGIPDIASLASDVVFVQGGTVNAAAGTSAATPLLSGMFALVNGLRMREGKRPLGFLNPFLYKLWANKVRY
jgi:tripeptidyl-peptidase-1